MATVAQHHWVTFSKGRIKLLGCACCGQMQLPSNREGACDRGAMTSSPLFRGGYRCEVLVVSHAA